MGDRTPLSGTHPSRIGPERWWMGAANTGAATGIGPTGMGPKRPENDSFFQEKGGV